MHIMHIAHAYNAYTLYWRKNENAIIVPCFCVLREMNAFNLYLTPGPVNLYNLPPFFRFNMLLKEGHLEKIHHFFQGMLLTSILALKSAPMSLVIVLRNTSPFGTLVFERFYPEPLRISSQMLAAIVTWSYLIWFEQKRVIPWNKHDYVMIIQISVAESWRHEDVPQKFTFLLL